MQGVGNSFKGFRGVKKRQALIISGASLAILEVMPKAREEFLYIGD